MIHWVSTTATQSDGFTPRGWKIHAIEGEEELTFKQAVGIKAKCGLTPSGWGLDLHLEKKCARCLLALGIACTLCRGKGSTGSALDGTWELCCPCGGTGEKEKQNAFDALAKARAAAP